MCYLANEVEYKIIRMTMNEKYFPKRARFIITNKLIDSAMNISENFKIGLAEIHYVFSIVNECEYK